MPEDLGEKTEQPTPKRKQEARDEGNVARSQDLSGALLLAGATAALWMFSGPMLGWSRNTLEELLAFGGRGDPMNADDLWPLIGYVGGLALRIAAPLLLIAWVIALAGNVLQIGFIFAPKGMQPKASKVNPIEGFKRVFGIRALVKAGLDSMKVAIVVAIAVVTIFQYRDKIVVLPYLELRPLMVEMGWLFLDLMLRVAAVLLILGIIDFAWQKWKHHEDMKMTKQQVKDELKQTEGDPEVKRRRMRAQQLLSSQRISSAVPQADVVVVNPEHISVAIRYEAGSMAAPKVIAKGADYLALRIRQIARQHSVPIVERKPLARALYREVPVGHEVPEQFYKAVAEILAYVYRMNQAA